ncbi:shikimate dehydrogenase [Friedmanniella endophytica]|uniref:Shikimate dehydrogenase n=1 Tax=Microlunatus kandeliicorticis TaxID=1759536 RepID=A0A7W3P6L8_9ACTN|nr:shikimate dehydrogenase [Microlunatus kandeliicorticis]MBA8795104.1 shikimate dehydrogenase [Microlunatus kandeliicorticis]
MTTRCAVLGSPIAHSLSPALHRAAYAHLGLTDWVYERHRVDEAGLAGFVDSLGPDWRGLSMTKPLKAVALGLGEPDEQVRLTGAANTLLFEQGRRRLFNTDIGGLTAALRAAGTDRLGAVTVLGAGGTTRAALVSVAALGADRVAVVARRPEQAAALGGLAEQLGLRLGVVPWGDRPSGSDLLVSTVVPDAAGDWVGRARTAGATFATVFDAVYDPWPTPLASAASDAGWTVVNGLDLLVHQAVEQVALMTGRSVPAAMLMSAGRKALSAREPA